MKTPMPSPRRIPTPPGLPTPRKVGVLVESAWQMGVLESPTHEGDVAAGTPTRSRDFPDGTPTPSPRRGSATGLLTPRKVGVLVLPGRKVGVLTPLPERKMGVLAAPLMPAIVGVLAFVVAQMMGVSLAAMPAAAQLPVFAGDPVDPATSLPYVILPGVASVQPGEDERFNSGDDVIQPSVLGDVDVVVRTGGGYAGGAIPAPAASVAAAPVVVAGGAHGSSGSEVAFQMILSDGATSPPAGNPLTGTEHDDRAVLVFAYPDLDGDGIVGATNADGSGDNNIERQESFAIVGRQVALIDAGVATGNLAVSHGAPASAGGLGLVVVGGALLGETAPEYFDGPWAGTLMPIMPPVDPTDIIGGGGGVRAPDPVEEYLVELELEYEKWFLPQPGHPTLGTPYAIPLDGSSVTVDLLQAQAGPATAVGLAVAIDNGSFEAGPTRRLLPLVGSGGSRIVAEATESLDLPDAGSGNARIVYAYAADLLGNNADPAAPITVTLSAGTGFAITSPNTDGQSQSETVTLATAEAVAITVDDTGGSGDRPAGSRLRAAVDGVPLAFVSVADGPVTCGNGSLDAGEACDDGNLTDGDGCESDCTVSLVHDSVVLTPKPLALALRATDVERRKRLKIKVQNADLDEPAGHTLRLVATDGTCPAGTVAGLPDFDRGTAGSQDTVLLAGGAKANAELEVVVTRAGFASVNHDTPTRCAVALSVESVLSGSSDPNPSNDATQLVIDVVDTGDSESAVVHQSFVGTAKAVSVRIGAGRAGVEKGIKVPFYNADVVPEPEDPGHEIVVALAPGDCPAAVAAALDVDRSTAGNQDRVVVRGGRKASASLTLSVQAADFTSRNAKSPARCTAVLSVSGPGGDSDPSNDTIPLIIDVIDGND